MLLISPHPQLHDLLKETSEERIQHLLQKEKTCSSSALAPSSSPVSTHSFLPLQSVLSALKALKENNENVYLHEALQGSVVMPPAKPVKEKSPQLIAILDKIRQEQADSEYYQMIKSAVRPESMPMEAESLLHRERPILHFDLTDDVDADADARAHDETKWHWQNETNMVMRTTATVVNVAFSIVSVFVATFWIAGTYSQDVAIKTLVSFCAALLIAVTEGCLIYFAILRDRKAAKMKI